jgi:hypothetical protein
MLRALVLALLAANAVVYGWGQGWLSPLLAPPGAAEREPERLYQQVRPNSITLVPLARTGAGADAASAPASSPGGSDAASAQR